MSEFSKKYLEAGAALNIAHGEYVGRLVDVQPLPDGYVCGVYRFSGGDCAEGSRLKVS